MSALKYKVSDFKFFFALFVSLIVIVSGVIYISGEGKNIVRKFNPLLVIINEVQLNVTEAHLWLEEYTKADSSVSDSLIYSKLKIAENNLNLLLDENQFDRNNLPRKILENDSIKRELVEISAIFENLSEKSNTRIQDRFLAYSGSDIDTQYDLIFNEIIKKLVALKMRIGDKIHSKVLTFEQVRLFVVLISFILLIYSMYEINRYIFQRNRNLEEIQKARLYVNVKNEEINAQNEEIQAQNEELDQYNQQILTNNIKLKQNEEWLRLSLSATSQGVWDMNVVTGEVITTDGIYTMLGYQPTDFDFTFPKWKELVHPMDKENALELFNSYIGGRIDKYENEFRMRTKPGGYCWVYSKGTIVERTSDNRALRIIGTHIDISDRKRYEQVIKENEEKYRTLFSNARDAILIMKNNLFIDFNEQAMRLFGCEKREELYLKSPIEFSPKYQSDGRKSTEKAIEKMGEASGSKHVYFDWTHIDKAGKKLETEISLSKLLIQNEPYILAIVRDITEKREAQLKLEEIEERWKYALEGAGDGVWDWNVKTNEVLFTKKWKEIIGFEEHEIENDFDEWDKRVHPEDKEQTYKDLNAHLDGKTKEYHNEHRLKCKDGSYKWILDRGKVIHRDSDGKPVRAIGTHSDITNRKIAENALKESEDRFQSMFDYMNSGVAIYQAVDGGKNFVVKDFNHAAEMISKRMKKESVGMHVLEVFPKLKETDLFAALKEVYETGEALSLPQVFYRDDLSEGWIECFIYKLPSGDIVTIFDDITERVQSEEAIKESRQKYLNIFHNAPLGILHYNEKGVLSDCNKSLENIIGSTKEKLVGLNMLTQLKDKKLIAALQKSLTLGEGIYEGYYESVTSRKITPVRAVFRCIRDHLGRYTTGIGLVEDISERKHQEEALEQSQNTLKETQRIAKIASFEYHFRSKQYTFSENFMDVLGRSKSEREQNTGINILFDNVHAEDKQILVQNYTKAFTQTDNFEYSYRYKTTDGTYKHINSTTRYDFDKDNNPLRFITVIQDYTQQKRTEELKREIEIAEETANIKHQFLANMSHEIRTPMTGIIGMIDFLMQTPLNKMQKEYVHTIKESSESLMNIVNDVLNLSKIEAGKLELRPKVFKPEDTIKEIRNLFKIRLEEKNIKLKTNYSKQISEYLYADEYRLKQVLTNLVSNAIKYTDEGFISIDFKQINRQGDDVEIKVIVEDTGVGISPSDQRKVFTKFSQFKVNIENALDGIGLGLVICKELVDLMGGNIGLESELGKGSIFWFTFKAKERRRFVEESPKKSLDFINLGKTIMLAEDKKVNQKVVTLMLNKLGCNVTIVGNGKEAVELLEDNFLLGEFGFDLILMDIQMPIMDGITAVKVLRSKYDNKLPPIIGLSANAMEGDAEHYIAEGLDDYLSKPVSKEMLYEKLMKWFSKK